MLDYVADQFKEKFGEDPRESRQTVQILHNDCDLAKIELSQTGRKSRFPAATTASIWPSPLRGNYWINLPLIYWNGRARPSNWWSSKPRSLSVIWMPSFW